MADRIKILSEENVVLKQKLEASDLINDLIGMLSTSRDLNKSLNDVLEIIGKHMKAERTFIFEKCGEKFSNTFEWCAEGVNSVQSKLQNLDPELFSVWYEKLEKGELVFEDDMAALKSTEKLIYRFAQKNNVHIASAVPIFIGGEMAGFLGVSNAPKETIISLAKNVSYLGAYIGAAVSNKMEHDRLLKANEEIREGKHLQEQLFDSISCGVFSYTVPQLELFGVNKEARNILEFEDGVDLTEAFLDFYENKVHPDDSERLLQAEKKLKKVGDEVTGIYRIICKSGIKHIRASMKMLKFSNGQKYIINSVLDVTEQINLTNALKREQKSCREAFQNNCEYTFFFDLTEGLIHEDFITAHEINIVKMLGLELPVSYDEMCRRYLEVGKLRFMSKDMAKHFTCKGIIEEYNKGITNVITEYYSPGPDIYTRANGLISRDEDTGHLHIFIVAEDVTELRRKEETKRLALKKENEELSRIKSELADHLGSGIFSYTIPERRILMLNKEARRMFDIPEDAEVVDGMGIMSKVAAQDYECIGKTVQELKNPGDRIEYVFHNVMKDGSLATIRGTTKLLSFSNGQKYILSSLNEITEQEALEVRLEEERRQYRNALMVGSETTVTIDLTEGIIDQPMITVDGRDILDELGLSLPVYYDDFARVLFDSERIETSSESINILKSRKKMLSAFKQGTNIIEADYRAKNVDQYIHCLVMLYKVDEHIKTTFIYYDRSAEITEEKKKIEIIRSLGKIYTGLYYVSFKDDKYVAIKHSSNACDVIPYRGSFEEYNDIYINTVVSDEHKEEMMKFFSREEICRKLHDTDTVKTDFHMKNGDICRVNIIAAKRDENGIPEAVVYAGYIV